MRSGCPSSPMPRTFDARRRTAGDRDECQFRLRSLGRLLCWNEPDPPSRRRLGADRSRVHVEETQRAHVAGNTHCPTQHRRRIAHPPEDPATIMKAGLHAGRPVVTLCDTVGDPTPAGAKAAGGIPRASCWPKRTSPRRSGGTATTIAASRPRTRWLPPRRART